MAKRLPLGARTHACHASTHRIASHPSLSRQGREEGYRKRGRHTRIALIHVGVQCVWSCCQRIYQSSSHGRPFMRCIHRVSQSTPSLCSIHRPDAHPTGKIEGEKRHTQTGTQAHIHPHTDTHTHTRTHRHTHADAFPLVPPSLSHAAPRRPSVLVLPAVFLVDVEALVHLGTQHSGGPLLANQMHVEVRHVQMRLVARLTRTRRTRSCRPLTGTAPSRRRQALLRLASLDGPLDVVVVVVGARVVGHGAGSPVGHGHVQRVGTQMQVPRLGRLLGGGWVRSSGRRGGRCGGRHRRTQVRVRGRTLASWLSGLRRGGASEPTLDHVLDRFEGVPEGRLANDGRLGGSGLLSSVGLAFLSGRLLLLPFLLLHVLAKREVRHRRSMVSSPTH
mmetsp:Transcript_11052/g.32067  ORF Transcript_11052/g.32067 Transcript_11052/m.32067 type:complete len:390 (-) Transcript_11052:73-1242(-)